MMNHFGISSSTALCRRCNDVFQFDDDIFIAYEFSDHFDANGFSAQYHFEQ